jgi:hypothetical protein
MSNVKITWQDGDHYTHEATLIAGYYPPRSLMQRLHEANFNLVDLDSYNFSLASSASDAMHKSRTGIIQWWLNQQGSGDYDIRELNSLLRELGMDKYTNKWEVVVFHNGDEVMTVIVEGGSDADAESYVLEHIEEANDEIKVPLKYTGSGKCLTNEPFVSISTGWLFEDLSAWTVEVNEYQEA